MSNLEIIQRRKTSLLNSSRDIGIVRQGSAGVSSIDLNKDIHRSIDNLLGIAEKILEVVLTDITQLEKQAKIIEDANNS